MQPWLPEKEGRPLVVDLLKSVGHLAMIGAVSDGNGWLDEKSVLKQFYVIAQPVGVE